MLKHFVIFTFEKDFFTDDNYNEYRDAFDIIKKDNPGIKEVFIRKNCVNRPANMDLMVEMLIDGETVLSEYLSHPEHVRMGQKYNPHVTNRVSFDYEV